MKLIDGIKKEGKPFEIPDSSRDEIPLLCKELGYKKGVEIGVAEGVYSEYFSRLGFEHYAIDPWIAYRGYRSDGYNLENYYQLALSRLKQYPNCNIIKKYSMEAVNLFADNSLDYVYIDGNHNFRYIADDLVEWSKKVRIGGLVSGHDYAYCGVLSDSHVKFIVNAYTKAFYVNPWYVIGSKSSVKGQKRDPWRSFMWIKRH